MKKILVVDDEINILKVVSATLQVAGYEADTVRTGEEALQRFKEKTYDLVISDCKLPGMDGLSLLGELKALNPAMPVILMTGYGTIEQAVNSMKLGSYSYLTKPLNVDVIVSLANEAIRSVADDGTGTLEHDVHFLNIIGKSAAMRETFSLIRRVSKTDANVLILGESGTGKELIARAIHYYSLKCGGPFIPLDCTTIPSELIESELFGHKKGAFTCAYDDKVGLIEMADKGTLFMDEIGDLDYGLQKKLLRFLQEKEFFLLGSNKKISVDVRVLAATNMNIEEAVEEGRFRSDLYYRLNVISIPVPPLRERKEDIPLLASHFLRDFNKRNNKNILGIEDSVMSLMMEYDWPGNVRELENTIERAVILCQHDSITLDSIPRRLRPANNGGGMHDQFNLNEIEKNVIVRALDANSWNQSKAADLLGISRKQLRTKMKNLGLMPQG